MPKPRVIYWFRTDLRLHDSPALKAALDLKPEALYPIWTWDPRYVYRARVGSNRWQFLLDCQKDLSESITKLNKKSQLFVIREAPTTILIKLFKEWNISHLVFEKDTDAYAKDRDSEVIRQAKKAGVEVIVKYGRTLWDPDEIVKQNGDGPTMSITQLEKAGNKIGPIPRPIPAPKSIPDPGDLSLECEHDQPSADLDFNAHHRRSDDQSYAQLSGPNKDFAVPTMEELGLKKATTPHRGGETIALKMLDKIISNKHYTATFEKPKTAPTAFAPQATTLLSPHLHFGSLSVREFFWQCQDVVDAYGPKASKPPTSLTGQLLFRDMYFGAQAKLGWKFGQTEGNSHCRFIDWHLQSQIDKETGLSTGKYVKDSEEADQWLYRWRNGCTGFPWIDAVMRQLKQEGWIHHLARHAVACFLTRGGCYISWERGLEIFEEWLIDHESACNTGNWQWLSCSAFYAQFYRCYSPIAFPQKTDKEGEFVRHFVPELKEYPTKYIYEPWKAPIVDQKAANCLIKGDGSGNMEEGNFKIYPKPMFDFAERREACLSGMKKAYQLKLYGNNPKVKNGSWREMFDAGKVDHSEDIKDVADHYEDVDEEEEGSKNDKKRKRSESQGKLDGHASKAQKAIK
ncbi:MAG: hypothetical protein M1814_003326 [Vezdaea aestivalis]|nr:MAG: hypothetical protein M1814_003326 [Vezdaea aestivalis]